MPAPADVDAAVQAAHQAFYDGRWSRKTPAERSLALLAAGRSAGRAVRRNSPALESENTGKPYQLCQPGGGHALLDRQPALLCRRRARCARIACRRIHGGLHLHVPPRAGRRGRADRALELPADDGRLEDRPGAGGRLHGRAQARPHDPADDPDAGRADRGSRLSRRGGQRDHRRQRDRPGAGRASPGAHGQPDRLDSAPASRSWRRPRRRSSASIWSWAAKRRSSSSTTPTWSWSRPRPALAATFNTGQDCTAATRVYVEQERLGQVKEAVVEAMRAVKIGGPFDDGVQMGPLISAAAARAGEGLCRAGPRRRRRNPDRRAGPRRTGRPATSSSPP